MVYIRFKSEWLRMSFKCFMIPFIHMYDCDMLGIQSKTLCSLPVPSGKGCLLIVQYVIWILIVSRVSQENRKLCEEPQSHQLLPLQAPRHALEGEGHLAVIFKAHCHTSKEPKRSLANQWLKFLDGRNKSKCPYICMIFKYFKCLLMRVSKVPKGMRR